MEQGVVRMLALLRTSDEPLSFSLVLPDWSEPPTPSITMLRSEEFRPFLRADIKQPKGRDLWIDGFQHHGGQRYFRAPWDGLLFVCQNDAGAQKWPASDYAIGRVLQGFSDRSDHAT